MNNRALEIAGFLQQCGWADAHVAPFAADFSSRHYARLEFDGSRRAIMMDADANQKTASFVTIAKLLRSLDVSVPEIIAADPAHGLVLMEDFGSRNFGQMLDSGEAAKPLYFRAVDVLVHVHGNFSAVQAQGLDLPIFDSALFIAQVELFLDFYFLSAAGRKATLDECETFRAIWNNILSNVTSVPQSLMLRDFMPDNLMDLPERKDWHSVGVLDFQDAGVGPIAYDLASLCEMVRRDGGDRMIDDVISYYHSRVGARGRLHAASGVSVAELKSACAILAAQRHMRILGIIMQLAKQQGRREKLAFLPRIWTYLDHVLTDSALKPLKEWIVAQNLRRAF